MDFLFVDVSMTTRGHFQDSEGVTQERMSAQQDEAQKAHADHFQFMNLFQILFPALMDSMMVAIC